VTPADGVGADRLAALQVVRGTILRAIGGRENDLVAAPLVPNWSSLDVVRHLTISEPHFIEEIATALARRPPVYANVEDDADAARLLQHFHETRHISAAWLGALSAEEWGTRLRFSSHPLLVRRTVSEIVDFMAFHERRHGAEIASYLAAL